MVHANREEVGSASWALMRVLGTDKGSLLVHVGKEHPEKQRSQSNTGFIFTKTSMEGMCDRKAPDPETLVASGGLCRLAQALVLGQGSAQLPQ